MATTCGVLHSEYMAGAIEIAAMAKAVDTLCRTGTEIKLRRIDADSIRPRALQGLDLLINSLGPYYPEEGWPHILNFYARGGVILNVGPRSFTLPYVVRRGSAGIMPETCDALSGLRVIDKWSPTGGTTGRMQFRVLAPRYRFLDQCGFPCLRESNSAFYNLAENDGSGHRIHAHLEPACGLYDPAGRLVCVPIARVDSEDAGALIFMNFTPAAPRYYASRKGTTLLSGMIRSALTPRVALRVDPGFARYYDTETPRVHFQVTRLGPEHCHAAARLDLDIEVSDATSGRSITRVNVPLSGGRKVQGARSLPRLPHGFYCVTAGLSTRSTPLVERRTGFYKLSDAGARKILRDLAPIEIDTRKSSDFCLRNGRPFAMHGANYHVTDRYRRCFVHLNAFRCDQDLQELRNAGINILRTGIWCASEQFYRPDGSIRETGLRSLDALFLTAARHGMPVQFVFGTSVMNEWDHSKCPVHNPAMRRKTMRAFSSFAQRFCRWPNVQIDVLNEPSYSRPGAWRTCRPSGDPHERKNWIAWLKKRYGKDISILRGAWGVSADRVPAFEKAPLPTETDFSRDFRLTPTAGRNFACLTDFFQFARESYSGWVAEARRVFKSGNRNMLFMMGQDEGLRVPSQQYETFRGNLDMTNWHQWNRDAVVFYQQLLNRVRGLPCCGQEVGVYHYRDLRGVPRLSDRECATMLERKLLYSFGNWLQWQAFCDPCMISKSETALGLFRADRTETPHLDIVRLLAWVEEKTAPLMSGRNERAIDILTIHPSHLYFSANSALGNRAAQRMTLSLHYHLKLQADIVLEHTLPGNQHLGEPELVIFPSALCMCEDVWQMLLGYAKRGKTVLVSGPINYDEYWRYTDRLKEIGISATVANAALHEELVIGTTRQRVSFHACAEEFNPSKVISKLVFAGSGANKVKTVGIGRGTLVLCPLPLELADSMEMLNELYRYALSLSGSSQRLFLPVEGDAQPGTLIYPISYRNCTAYTVVNEGTDETVRFVDLRSGARVSLRVKGQRGAKLWLGKTGDLLGAYLTGPVSVGGQRIVPNGDLCLVRRGRKWDLFPGKREKHYLVLNGRRVVVGVDGAFRSLVA